MKFDVYFRKARYSLRFVSVVSVVVNGRSHRLRATRPAGEGLCELFRYALPAQLLCLCVLHTESYRVSENPTECWECCFDCMWPPVGAIPLFTAQLTPLSDLHHIKKCFMGD